MILCDSNLLLYAYNPSARQHTIAANWLEGVLNGQETVGFCWPVLSAFLRISTNSRAFENALTMEEAVDHVNTWLERETSQVVLPTADHWVVFMRLVKEGNVRGRTSTDAEIATYAVEHGATLYTADQDFRRFPSLQFINPLGA